MNALVNKCCYFKVLKFLDISSFSIALMPTNLNLYSARGEYWCRITMVQCNIIGSQKIKRSEVMNGYDFRLPSVMLINKGTWTPCYLMRIDFQQARCLSALCEPYNVLRTVASGPALSLCKCQTHFTKSLQIKLCNKCHNWFLDGQFQKLNWQLAQSRLVHLQKNFP